MKPGVAAKPVKAEAARSTGWWLYLLECAGGKLYAGISPDPAARFERHKAGKGARYTRANKPLRILAVESFPDRSTASVAEYGLKSRSRAEKIIWARDRAGQAVPDSAS